MLLMLLGFACFKVKSQTNPTPHNLKAGDYIFTHFAGNPSSTTYPPSMQGWSGENLFIQPTASTTIQAKGDLPLRAHYSPDSVTFNNDSIDGISFMNSSDSGAFALALALNTTDCYGNKVAWLSVPRGVNPISVTVIQLQYRVGVTGVWANVPNSSDQTDHNGTAKGHKDFVSVLPAACDNKPVVQLRWMLYNPDFNAATNRFSVSKIHVMPDSTAGQTGYRRAGGNIDSTGAQTDAFPYGPFFITRLTTTSGLAVPADNNNKRAGLVNGYSDYTGLGSFMTLATDNPVDLNVLMGVYSLYATPVLGVYVDWNQDKDFDDSDEYFQCQSTNATTSNVATISVPAGAKSGYTRMRVRVLRSDVTMTPAGPAPDGETEDYKVFVDNFVNPLPDCIDKTTCVPKDDSLICMSTDSLRWGAISGATGYHVTIIDSVANVVVVDSAVTTKNSFSLAGVLQLGKTYRWFATAYDAGGEAMNCDTLTFKTSTNADPVVDITPHYPTAICKGATVALNGNPTLGTTPYQHSWNGTKNSLISDTAKVDPVFNGNTAVGSYTYTYTVQDKNYCKATDTIIIEVQEQFEGGVLSFEAANFCPGNSVKLVLRQHKGSIAMETSASKTGPWTAASVTNVNDTTFTTLPLADTTYFRAVCGTGMCADTSNVLMVPVKPNPAKPILAATSITICQGETATLEVTNYTSNITWNDAATTNSPKLNVTASGKFIAKVTVNGCSAVSDEATVTVNPVPAKPTITVIGKNPTCEGDSVKLKSSSATGNLWSNNSTDQTITVYSGGEFTVTVTNSFGCSSTSDKTTIVVNAAPDKPVILADGPLTFCAGDSVTLSCSYATGNKWSSGQTTQDIKMKTSGTRTVLYTDANGCKAESDPVTVTVNALPAKPSISSSGQYCDGNVVTLKSSYTGGNTWNTSTTTDSIDIQTTGDYTVTYTDANGCSMTSNTFKAIFKPTPDKPEITSVGKFCQGSTVELTSSASSGNTWSTGSTQRKINITTDGDYTVKVTSVNGCFANSDVFHATFEALPATPVITRTGEELACDAGADSYQWYGEDGEIVGATTKDFAPTKSGKYSVKAFSSTGCESEMSDVYVFNGTGISKFANTANLEVYPNPSSGNFVVNTTANSGSWTMVSANGSQVAAGTFQSGKFNVNLDLPKGIYFFMLTGAESTGVSRVEVH